MFFRNTDCCVLTYDVTDAKTFTQAKEWKTKFLDSAFPVSPEEFPFVLLGNKKDMRKERKTNKSDAVDWSRHQKMFYREVSAVNGDGFEGLFDKIVEKTWPYAVEKARLGHMEEGDQNIVLGNVVEQETKKNCCM